MTDQTKDQRLLTSEQAYEAAFRFVAQYYERERIGPLLSMVTSMRPTDEPPRTGDPASWYDWERCVEDTLSHVPLPDQSPPED
ncbi:MAG TPA: hypothetical protein VII96_07930 [Acidimicrobiales bacterium]